MVIAFLHYHRKIKFKAFGQHNEFHVDAENIINSLDNYVLLKSLAKFPVMYSLSHAYSVCKNSRPHYVDFIDNCPRIRWSFYFCSLAVHFFMNRHLEK